MRQHASGGGLLIAHTSLLGERKAVVIGKVLVSFREASLLYLGSQAIILGGVRSPSVGR